MLKRKQESIKTSAQIRLILAIYSIIYLAVMAVTIVMYYLHNINDIAVILLIGIPAIILICLIKHWDKQLMEYKRRKSIEESNNIHFGN